MTVGDMSRVDQYQEAARTVAFMARELASHAEQRPVNTGDADKIAQHIGLEIARLNELGFGLEWCESCGNAYEEQDVDENNHCAECRHEGLRNRAAMSRN